jgi:cell division protein FtsZ
MQGAGSALMGIGSSRGDDRAVQAAELAISSPLLEASIDGAHGVLLSIQGGSDLGLFEINEAARLVQEAAHPEANLLFGAVIDDALGDEVRVTVIAAGFDGGAPLKRENDRAIGTIQGSSRPAQPAPAAAPVGTNGSSAPAQQAPAPAQHSPAAAPAVSHPEPAQVREPVTVPATHPEHAATREPAGRPPRTVTFDEADDLDVPDFLK